MQHPSNNEEIAEHLKEVRTYLYSIASIIGLTAMATAVYLWADLNGWSAHLNDWLHLVIRWAHVVLGIAWIGASFYFIFLENSLNRTKGLRDELDGNLWAIHGGGFYYVEKYKAAPGQLPEKLHWFKYEAYFTWLSGMMLLMMVYYFNAEAYMVDPSVSGITPFAAILIGLGTIIGGWFIYDVLCSTSLLHKKKAFALTGFLIIVIISWILSHLLSGRAAFMHIGALLGTIMAGNVFFVIIPSQKALVRAAKAGLPPDPAPGKYAGLRSLHNNYITLPVIFVMISNHFPVTFGQSWNWIILAVLTIASVAVRHYINQHEKGIRSELMLPFAFIALIALVMVTAPRRTDGSGEKVTFSQVEPVIKQRCATCHSENPTDETQASAPNGIRFDTPAQIKKMADRILVRAVHTRTMPQGNKTNITEEERELIGRWIAQGALTE